MSTHDEIAEKAKANILNSVTAVSAAATLLSKALGLDSEKEASIRAAFANCYRLGYDDGAQDAHAVHEAVHAAAGTIAPKTH